MKNILPRCTKQAIQHEKGIVASHLIDELSQTAASSD